MPAFLPIIDSYGRAHKSLRISVTDRCNIRCVYCMPENVKFLPRRDVLTFEEIVRFVQVVAKLGVHRVRLTGGEPLVRSQLPKLVEMLKSISLLREVTVTTNAVLLDKLAQPLRDSGLDRINISLDTVDPDLFFQLTRRNVMAKVMDGIQAAIDAGFEKIRINAVPVPALSDDHIVALARFAKQHQLELRFIEFMPLDGDQNWDLASVRSGAQIKALLDKAISPLKPVGIADPSQPAVNFQYQDDGVNVGFIDSVTAPFCGQCDRMRLTAEGKLRNCLFSNAEWDVKQTLRNSPSESDIEAIVREAIAAKKAGHGSDDLSFLRPERAMYQIGG